MISDSIYDSRFLGSRDILIPVTSIFGCRFDFREVDGLVGIFDIRMYRYTDAGYRLYDDADLERLQHILLFRELEFPLKDIKMIVNSPDFDRSKALEQQIELLKLKKEHIENLMNFALGIKLLGVKHMDFKAFDRSKLDEYSRQAKELYGNTPEYKEMEEKQKNRTEEDEKILADRFMLFFKEAGEMKNMNPAWSGW
mgnify:CR=1 FL=1